jgi:hypothetical protein
VSGDVFELVKYTGAKVSGRRAALKKTKGSGKSPYIGIGTLKHQKIENMILHWTDDDRLHKYLTNLLSNVTGTETPSETCDRCAKPWKVKDELSQSKLCQSHYNQMLESNNRHKHWEHVADKYEFLTGTPMTTKDYHSIISDVFEHKTSVLCKTHEYGFVHQVSSRGVTLFVKVVNRSRGTITEMWGNVTLE